MAIAVTQLTAGGSGTNASSYVTASITPAANALILAGVLTSKSGTPDTPTLTGNGLTWVEVTSCAFDNSGTAYTLRILRALGASPSAGAVTIDYGGVTQAGTAWCVAEVTGIDTGGTNGSAAVVQSAKSAEPSVSVTSVTATLAASVTSGNRVVGIGGNELQEAITPEASWVELGEGTHAGPSATIHHQWRDADTDNSATMSWTTASQAGIVIVEVKAAGGAAAHPLVGAIAGSATAAATRIVIDQPLGGAITGTSTATGLRIIASHPLAGNATATATVTATSITVSRVLSGAIAGTATATASQITPSHPLTASVAGFSAATASTLGVGHILSGSIAGGATATATGIVASHPLWGAVTATGAVTASQVRVIHLLTGTIVGVSGVTGSFSEAGTLHPLSGSVAALSAVIATRIRLTHPIDAFVAGQGSASAHGLALGHALAGLSSGVAGATGAISLAPALPGNIRGVAVVTGALADLVIPVTHAVAYAALDRPRLFTAIAIGSVTLAADQSHTFQGPTTPTIWTARDQHVDISAGA